MSQDNIYQKLQDSVNFIKDKSKNLETPLIGLVLGSGVGGVGDIIENETVLLYKDIPHFYGTSVEGREGRIRIGRLFGVPTVILEGGYHLYEGYPMQDVVLPTRVACALGIHTLVLTNAAGGINPRYRPGDLMIIEDHINLMGNNPLKGPDLQKLGPRFPDMSDAYNKDCQESLIKSAKSLKIKIHHGVYAGVLGPTYETPAEVRMLRTLGADAVGMSTVPESIAAIHLGVRVAGLSCITNLAAGLSKHRLSHLDVLQSSKGSVQKLQDLLSLAFPKLNHLRGLTQ